MAISGSSGSGPAAKVAAVAPGIPDYEPVRIVGRGSFGDVWLARSVTGAWRAIKVVWRERFTEAEPFEREFRGLKEFADVSLGESSQLALLHVGRNDAAGFFFSVMELADDVERGRHIDPESYVPLTLAEMRSRRGRLPADECTRLGAELARSLATLHRCGLVHRDVKPSNVIVVNGVPKLADIGLVAPTASAHTFVGTEGFVPPEGPGTPGADVYALGKMLYELSTGHDRQEFPKLPGDLARLPDRAALLELNEILLRACGQSPAQRYRDGAAVLADLTALNAGVSLRSRRVATLVIRSTAVVALVVALASGAWYGQTRLAPDPPPAVVGIAGNSVAVLPFANASGDRGQDYFADGISIEILRALERERDLRVAGSRSSFWVKDQSLSSMQIAEALRVAHLVEGTVQRQGTRVRVAVRLTRGVDGVGERLGTYEQDATGIVALQDEVARAVAKRLLHRVTVPALLPSTSNVEAYDAFLRGRALQVRAVRHAPEAAKHFERAVVLDPDFAVAWVRLADARRMAAQSDVHGAWQDIDGALDAAERAIDVQPELAVAWTVRGFIRGLSREDSALGLQDLVRAEELGGPNAETRMTRFLMGWFAGEAQGLLPLAREAIACDPENVERPGVVTLALWYLGDYSEADRLYRRGTGPGQLYQHAGDFVARVHLRRAWRGAEAALRLAEQAAPDPAVGIEMRVRMLAELGRVTEAAQLVGGSVEPLSCHVYAAAGMVDRARNVAEAALPDLREQFANLAGGARNDSDLQRKDEARSRLIGAEIIAGNREVALELLDAWWREAKDRQPNRRSGGLYIVDLPRYFAMLGRHEVALVILRQFVADGRSLGYELRDTSSYAGVRDDPRFLELRQQAEAWAAAQPDPPDDPAAAIRRRL